MYDGIDTRGNGFTLNHNERPYLSLYFVSFIVIGKIFIMNLFVGIVIDKYNRLKEKMKGYSIMTKDQREWVEAEKQMCRLKLVRAQKIPEKKYRLLTYKLQQSKPFNYIVDLSIVISIFNMSFHNYKMEKSSQEIILLLNIVITHIHNIEFIIKLTALGFEYFNESDMNKLDFIVIICNNSALIIDIFIKDQTQKTTLSEISMILKVVRVFRVFRCLRKVRGLRVILDCMRLIAVTLGNVGSLIMLMFFIFAIIGMNSFSGVKHQIELNENNNFTTFGMSLIVLLRCATGEKWNVIMRELAVDKKHINQMMHKKHDYTFVNSATPENEFVECLDDQSFNHFQLNGPQQCGTQMAYLYFCLFIVVINIMMFNLLMAVILDGYQTINQDHTGSITQEMLDRLV